MALDWDAMEQANTLKHRPSKKRREQVKMLASLGLDKTHIAAMVGVSRAILYKYYMADFEKGLAEGCEKVARRLIYSTEGNDGAAVQAQKFWLERRGGDAWKAKSESNVNVSGGVPTVNVVFEGHDVDGEGDSSDDE